MERSCLKKDCYDTPKYVVHILEGAVSKKYRCLPRIKSPTCYNESIADSNCHRGGNLNVRF